VKTLCRHNFLKHSGDQKKVAKVFHLRKEKYTNGLLFRDDFTYFAFASASSQPLLDTSSRPPIRCLYELERLVTTAYLERFHLYDKCNTI